jgi:DNA-directed RNA polymerase subunit RPC12/RpoP
MSQERDLPSEQAPAAQSTFPCGGCGADLTFAPGTSTLKCEYCGHEQQIGAETACQVVQEHSFAEGLAKARRIPAANVAKLGQEVQCNSCGARTVVEGRSDHCPYCDLPVVVAKPAEGELIAPESLLPFKLDRRAARDKFLQWVASLWFAPSGLGQRAAADRIDGLYLPYWTYDSQTTTRYTGQRGEHYWVEESYTDGQGKRQTRRVRKTRWYPASGVVRVPFDDVLVCASKSLPRWLTERLEPWDLHELKPFEPAFLSGFVTERYALDLEGGFKIAEERMADVIRGAIRRDIGGDEQRIGSMHVQHANTTFKHLLLPLWISSFRWNQKVFRFIVNARTGEVAGERPWSWVKIALLVLAILVVVGVVIALASAGGGAPPPPR